MVPEVIVIPNENNGESEAAEVAANEATEAAVVASDAAQISTDQAEVSGMGALQSTASAEEAQEAADTSVEAATVSVDAATTSTEMLAQLKASMDELPNKFAALIATAKEHEQATEPETPTSEPPQASETIPADEKPHNDHWWYKKIGGRK